jgi:hypothetical protein
MSSIALIANAAIVVARALIPIAGVVFLGWSAPKLLVVYFADTAAAYYAFLSALALATDKAIVRGVPAVIRAVLVPLPTLALVGFFFGILPLFVMLDLQDVAWRDLLRDGELWRGVALQFVLAFAVIVPRAWQHATGGAGGTSVRLQGACLTLRWLGMIVVGFFMAPGIPRIVYGPVLIAVYAAMTAALELAPVRVLSWARRAVSRDIR